MKRALLALATVSALSLAAVGARAQGVVADSRGCGNAPQQAGIGGYLTVDPATGNLCTNANGSGGGTVAQTTSNGTDGQATNSNNQANVTYNYLFNGSTWDRWRGTTAGGALVNVTDFPTLFTEAGSAGTAVGQGSTGTAANSQTMQGLQTAGQPPVGLGLLLMGFDGTNEQYIRVSSNGQVQIAAPYGGQSTVNNGYNFFLMGGYDQNNKGQPLQTDGQGRLKPAGAIPAAGPAITSIAASTATAIKSSATTSAIGVEIQTESANSAPIYICYQETTTCSATVHEDIIPVSSAIGTKLVPLYNWTGTIYAYTTSATSVRVNTWSPN